MIAARTRRPVLRIRPTSLACGVIAAAAMLAAPLRAQAQTTFTKANNTNNLNLGTSWTSNSVPTSTDILLWSSTVTTSNTSALGGDLSVLGLQVTNPTGAITIANTAGATLTLGASGIDMSTATQNLTINPNINIGANQDWTVKGGLTLTGIAGASTSSGTGTGNINMVQAGSGVATIVFNQNGNNTGGQTGWTNYSGNITVNSNIKLQSQGNAAVALGSGTIVLAGGQVSQIQGTWTWGNNFDVTAASVIGNDSSNGLGRSLKLLGTLTSTNGSGLTFTNNVTGGTRTDDVGFILAGASASTYGTTTISANSRVRVGGNSTATIVSPGADAGTRGSLGTGDVSLVASTSELAFTRTDAITVGNNISGLGTVVIGGTTTAMAGTVTQVVTLTGTNTYSGATTVKAGALVLSATAAKSGASTVTVAAGATIGLGVGSTSAYFGSADVAGLFANTLSGFSLNATSGVGIDTSAGNFTYSTNIGSVTRRLLKTGSNALTLSGSNAHSGGTTLSAGQLNINNANAIGTGTFTISTGTIDNTSGGAITLATNNAQSWGGDFTFAGSNPLNLGTGTVALTANRQVTVTSSTLTVGGTVGGAFSLTKAGAGTLVLNGSSGYSGGTTLSEGTIVLGNANALGTGAVAVNAGTLDLNGNSPTLNLLTGSSGATIRSGVAGAVILTATTASTGTFAGAIVDGSGTVAFTKVGSGTLTLSGANTYSGTTSINGGVLQISGNLSLGSNLGGVSTSTLRFGANTITIGTSAAGDSSSTYNGTVDGTGTIRLRGGSNTIMGVDGTTGTSGNAFAIVPATAQMPPTAFALDTGASATDRKDFGFRNDTSDVLTLSSLTGFGAIRGDGNGNGSPRFITVNQAADTTFNGAIVSSVSTGSVSRPITFEKQGAGTLTLAGFIGRQTVGTLSGSGAPVNLIANGGMLLITNTFNSTTGSTAAINSSGTVTITSGTLGFAPQALINTAGTQGVASIQMNGGVLQWYGTNTQDISAGSRFVLVNSQTATLDTNGNNVTLATGFGGTTSAVLVKNGVGTLTLSASNSWTGGSILNVGMLSFGTNGLGTTGNVTLNSGTLQWATGNSQDISSRLTLVSGSTAVLDINGNGVTLGSAFGGNTSAAVTVVGSGSLRLAGANTFTGVTTLNTGTVSVSSLANGGAASPVGASPAAAGNLVLNNTTLVMEAGSAASSTDRLFTLAGSGTILNNDATAADTLSFTNTGTIGHSGNGTRTLALGGTNGGTNVFAPTLTNNPNDGSAVSLRKAGSSIWSITGTDNSYTGSNNLAGGTVIVQKLANGGANSSLGASSSVESNLVLNGVSLTYQGGGDTTDRAFRISSNSTINASGSGALTWSGSGIGFGTINTAYTLTLGGTSTAANTFGTPIGNNGSGAISLTKRDAGTWVLSTANTYTGVTTVSGGTLSISADNRLGTAPGSVTAGSLVLNGGALAVTSGFTLNSNRSIALGPAAGTATGTIDVASGQLLTIGGTIANNGGTGALTKLGSGTLSLGGANTFTGTTTISGGILQVTNAGALGGRGSTSGGTPIVITSGTLDLGYTATANSYASNTAYYSLRTGNIILGGQSGASTGIISTSSSVNGALPPGLAVGGGFGTSITYDATNNPGTATIASIWGGVGSSSAVTATVTVGDSTATDIELDYTGSIGTPSTSGATDNQSATLVKAGPGTMRISGSNNFPGLTVSAGTLIVNNVQALGRPRSAVSLVTNNGVLDLNGFSPTTIGLMLGSGTLTNAAAATTGTLTMGNANNQSGTFSGLVTDGAGAVAILKLTSGTLGLSGSNSYSGGTTLSAGMITVGSTTALGTGPVAVNSGTLNLNGQNLTIGVLTGSSGATIRSNTVGSITLTSNAASSGTFEGTIANGSGTVGFAKAGAGTLTLGGANTYTGVTTITAGTLAVSSDSNLGTAPGSATAGQLAINGGALSATAGFTLNSNRGLAVGPSSGSGNGTIDVASGTLAYGGIVANNGAGTGGLVKTGAGRLQLTGVNTYSGPTTISTGTLEIGGAGQLGSGSYAGAVTNNAALAFTTSANQTLSGGVTGIGSLAKSGAGVLTIQGSNDYSGATTVSGGSVVVNGAITASAMTVSGGAVLGGSGSAASVTLAGGVISPGNSPGNLTLGDLSWDATSSYKWEMYDYQSTAGTGWDLITGTGALSVTGTGFTFNLVSLNALPNTVGLANNWSQTTSGTFLVATFSGGITAPGGQWWTVNTGSFTPYSALTGSFTVSTTANDMFLVYTYTPPPAYVWTAGDGSWSTGANWSTDPLVPAGTADIIFSGTGGASVNDITSGTGGGELGTVSSLTFSGSASGPYTISGNGFTLGSGGIVNQSASTQTVQNDLALNAASIADAQAADLVLSGSVVTAGYGLTVTGSSNTLISGVVTGAGGLTKLSAGTLTLSGSNDFTGGTTITTGSLVVGDGATSGVLPGNVTNNAVLAFNRSDDVTFAGTISGTGSLTKLGANTLTLSGSNSYSGATTISGGTLAFTSTANESLVGVISGAGALAKGGASTLTLTAVNTYAGDTTISSGTLAIGGAGQLGGGSYAGGIANAGVFSVATTADQTLAGAISGTGSLAKSAAGTLTLTGTSTYTGSTTISTGTLVIGGAGQLGGGSYAGAISNASVLSVASTANQTLSGTISGAGSLLKSAAGTLTLTAANTFSGGATLSAGTLLVGNNAALGTGTATLSGGTLSSDGGTARSMSNAVTIAGDVTLGDATNSGALTFSGPVSLVSGTRTVTAASDVAVSGTVSSGGLIKDGAAALTLSAANTFAGGFTLTNGTVRVGNNAALGTGQATLNGGVLSSDGATARSLSNGLVIGGPVTLGDATNNGALTLSGTVNLGGGTRQITIASTGTMSGVISNGGLTKAGGGALTLTAANTFTGGVSLDAGTLQAGDVNALGSGTLTINSGTLTTGATQLALPNNIVLAASATFAGTAGTQGMRLDGIISGIGGFTKEGTGRVTLMAANTFSGSTTINGGILAVTLNALATSTSTQIAGTTSGGLAIGSNGTTTINNLTGTVDGRIRSDFSISSDGTRTLAVNQSTDGTFDGTFVQGDGGRTISLVKFGSAVLTLTNAANAYTGTTAVNAGTLRIGGAGRLNNGSYAGAISIAQDAVLQFDSTAAQTLSGVVSGSGTLRTTSTGTLTLSGASSYAGTIDITGGRMILTTNNTLSGTIAIGSGGTLQVGNNSTNGFIGNAATVVNDGAIEWNRSNDTNVNTLISGGGTLTKLGAGILSLNGDNTFAGTTTITSGTLRLGGGGTAGALGSGGVVNNATFAFNRSDALTVANAISGGGSIVQQGTGMTTLTGTNSYAGTTTISSGTLRVGNGGTAGTLGGGNVINSASLVLDRSDAVTLANAISGAGSVIHQGAGITTLTGSSSYTGATVVSGGTLALGSGGSIAAATALNLSASGATFDLTAASGNVAVGGLSGAAGSALILGGNSLTATIGTASAFDGVISGGGGFTKTGSGKLTLTGTNSYAGTTTISGGTLALSGGGSIQSSSGVSLTATGATFDISGASGARTINALSGTAGSFVLLGGNGLTAGDATSSTFGGVISGSGGFTKAGSGVLTLSAAQSLFTGDVNVSAGTLKMDGANYLQEVADRIFVADNATLDGSAEGFTVFSGQTLGGYGTINAGTNALAFNSGAFLSPGGSVGQLDGVGAATFNGGMTYLFEINDANGTFGTSPGWDLFTTTGTLTLAASGGNPINLDILSLAGSGTGLAANFDPTFNYAWKFVVAGAPISSFSPTVFNVDATGFSNPTNGGQFYVARGDQLGSIGGSGTDEELYVVFAAVPEPSTVVLAGIGLAAAGVAAARRRRRVNREGSVG